MTVGELIALLEDYDEDTIVIISSDGEGNNFSPLSDVGAGHYIEQTGWSGDFVSEEDAIEDDNINLESAEPAIVLWPTN